jgi:hypothetical protein
VTELMSYGAAAADASPASGWEPEPLEWEEALFRRQYSGEPIAHQLRHLLPHVPRLLSLYSAYFYFRVRGFVLHSGVKLGVDYMAYPPGGPPRWHAQFAILVGPLEHTADVAPAGALTCTPTNAQLDNVQRCMQVSLNQKKSLLYVRVLSSLPPGGHPFDERTADSAAVVAPAASSATASSGTAGAPFASLYSDPSCVFRSCSVSVSLVKQWFITKGRGAGASGAVADRARNREKAAAGKASQQQQQERNQQRKDNQQQQQQQQNKKQKLRHDAASAPIAAPAPPAVPAGSA